MSERSVLTALAFARRFHPVLPLHYPVGTDKLTCSCGRLCGKNAAKHPYGFVYDSQLLPMRSFT
jgi:hypothetical protein